MTSDDLLAAAAVGAAPGVLPSLDGSRGGDGALVAPGDGAALLAEAAEVEEGSDGAPKPSQPSACDDVCGGGAGCDGGSEPSCGWGLVVGSSSRSSSSAAEEPGKRETGLE